MVGARRSAGHALCASGFGIPLSQGAIQKRVDRVAAAILPHSTAIGEVARPSRVHDMDATSWRTRGDRRWLWGRAHPLGADFQLPPPAPQERLPNAWQTGRAASSAMATASSSPGRGSGRVAGRI
jgi:hypothetical protein